MSVEVTKAELARIVGKESRNATKAEVERLACEVLGVFAKASNN